MGVDKPCCSTWTRIPLFVGATLWLVAVIFLFDLLVAEHGWCGHLVRLVRFMVSLAVKFNKS